MTNYDNVYGCGADRFICAHEYIDNNIHSFGINEAFEVLRKNGRKTMKESIVSNSRNYKYILENFNFHDSEISSINITHLDNGDRKLELIIDYYNWEGNKENSGSQWEWKKLKLVVDYLAIFEWNAPDYINNFDASIILQATYDKQLDDLYNLECTKAKKYKNYVSPVFNRDNFLSVEFLLNSFEDGLLNDTGYIRIIGSNINYEWINSTKSGQLHIPISDK